MAGTSPLCEQSAAEASSWYWLGAMVDFHDTIGYKYDVGTLTFGPKQLEVLQIVDMKEFYNKIYADILSLYRVLLRAAPGITQMPIKSKIPMYSRLFYAQLLRWCIARRMDVFLAARLSKRRYATPNSTYNGGYARCKSNPSVLHEKAKQSQEMVSNLGGRLQILLKKTEMTDHLLVWSFQILVPVITRCLSLVATLIAAATS
jgi:hypothetical protein